MSDELDTKAMSDGIGEALNGVADSGVEAPAEDLGHNAPWADREDEAQVEEHDVGEAAEEEVEVPAEEVEAPPQEVEEVAAEAAEETPDFDLSFTVHGEKKEFDDWAKQLVKDEDSYNMMKDVMHKVHGIEHIKADREALRGQLGDAQNSRAALDREINTLSHYLQTGNLDAFFKTLDIPEETVFKYTQNRLSLRDMTPEQRQAYEQRYENDAANYNLQQENASLREQNFATIVEQKRMDVNNVISRPEISEFASAFDERMGREGAFRDEVWNRGRMRALGPDKVNLTAEQAVSEVLELVGGGYAEEPAAAESQQAGPQSNPGAQIIPPTQQQVPVIPKVDGTGASPTRPAIGSLDDLRRTRKERFG